MTGEPSASTTPPRGVDLASCATTTGTTSSSTTTFSSLSLFEKPQQIQEQPKKPILLPEDVTFARPGKPQSGAVATKHNNDNCTAIVDDGQPHRAVHRIRLSALEHNYSCVEQAANQQRCSVITVVKADGYGHGAIATALHLADCCGADAFAVATLEEAIDLRRAFETNPAGRWSKQLASHFHVANNSRHPASWATAAAAAAHHHPAHLLAAAASSSASTTAPPAPSRRRSSSISTATQRPARIRILVLGPPVGFPRCFDDYYHHNIEVMVSGPEVAAALLAWIADDKERKRTQVERAANETMAQALLQPRTSGGLEHNNSIKKMNESRDLLDLVGGGSGDDDGQQPRKSLRHPSSTLGNVSGQDLAKEIRVLLMKQKEAEDASNLENERLQQQQQLNSRGTSTANSSDNSVSSDASNGAAVPQTTQPTGSTFVGIEALAKSCRAREKAAQAASRHRTGAQTQATTDTASQQAQATAARKRLRWHALVDSGMGRLGFKTDQPGHENNNSSTTPSSSGNDTVAIIKEMVDAEIHHKAPIEFYGMMTHMADANAQSTYTNDQIDRFTGLLRRVRQAGISVPTVSTDNSAALLTTSLQHFDPSEILSQSTDHHGADSRGYVRVGGAIYGQRPAFSQLKAVSTLTASVRHVAVLKRGESVGYDRAYVADHNVRIATLTIGFADGYPRVLGNGAGQVEIRGEVFPVAGNVCMDMLMVDLGPADDVTGIGASVAVGDVAILWGPAACLEDEGDDGSDNDDYDDQGQVRLQDLAERLQTTQSALTCGLDKIRVCRHFV